MPRAVLLCLLLLTTACTGQPEQSVGQQAAACEERPVKGPVLLQEPPQDVTGPFYYARTDGPCGLLVTFVGTRDGEGPCRVEDYSGRVEPAGDGLRLVVDEEHAGSAPGGVVACEDVGQHRSLRVALSAPLAGGASSTSRATRCISSTARSCCARAPCRTVGRRARRVSTRHCRRTGPTRSRAPACRPSCARAASSWSTPCAAVSATSGSTTGRCAARRASSLPSPTRGGNHLLTWVEGERGFVLQVLGRLRDADVLVEVADGLRGSS